MTQTGEAPPAGERPATDPAMAALEELTLQVREAQEDLQRVLERAEVLRTLRSEGRAYAEIVTAEQRPLIVELISDTMGRLADSGGRWRREEARALHREGLSMDRIAQLFGVTRQRVSALLSSAPSQRDR